MCVLASVWKELCHHPPSHPPTQYVTTWVQTQHLRHTLVYIVNLYIHHAPAPHAPQCIKLRAPETVVNTTRRALIGRVSVSATCD